MEQNNYLEFEKSKAAVYTIMEACFQDVFDLEDDELGSFHDEIDEYMNQNQKGSWLPENQMTVFMSGCLKNSRTFMWDF